MQALFNFIYEFYFKYIYDRIDIENILYNVLFLETNSSYTKRLNDCRRELCK